MNPPLDSGPEQMNLDDMEYQSSPLLETPVDAQYGFGFAGAPIVQLESLRHGSVSSDVVLFGVDGEVGRIFGTSNPGAATFVRGTSACMMPWTRAQGDLYHDIGVIAAADPETTIRNIASLSAYVGGIRHRPAMIACDHTATIAAFSGLLDVLPEDPIYIYFDAHYDLGLHADSRSLDNGNFINLLLQSPRVAEVVNVGGRSWATFSPIYAEIPGFRSVAYSTEDDFILQMEWLRGRTVYVSIDADVLDAALAPGACCPEPFGMSAKELLTACEWIGRNTNVVGADLSEIVPSAQNALTVQVLMRSMLGLFPHNG